MVAGGTGAVGYVKYIYETSFKNGGSAVRAIGIAPKLSASDKKNNLKSIYGLGSQDATIIIDGQYEGRGSLEFAISNPWFFTGLLGGVSTPTTTTFTSWVFLMANSVPSFTVENGLELGATDYVTQYKGCVMDSMTISMEVGNAPVTGKIDFVYADETSSTTSSLGTAPTDTETQVWNFAMGKLELPTGTVIGEVEKASISIKRNAKLIYGLGDRRATAHIEGQREFSVDLSALLESTVLLEKFFANTGSATGPASTAITEITSMTLAFSNDGWAGATATSKRITIVLTGCKIDTFGAPMECENGVMVSMSIIARTIAVTVINQTPLGSKPADITAISL
jgi:hypothetical protein